MSIKTNIFLFFTIHLLISAGQLFAQESPSSNSGLKSKVAYTCTDSIRFDVNNQKAFLFNNAKVNYEDTQLEAYYIEIDMANDIVFAQGALDSSGKSVLDSAGNPIGRPVFADGGKSFDAKEITYNFKTRKGKIKDVTTEEGEGFIHANDAKKDSSNVYYIRNGRYTTCNNTDPHFYIKASKLKIIPDDKIITGPANLVIAGLPTPLALPFGIFPNNRNRTSGILIPTYGESELGFFLKDGGYYFGISDYFDLALRGDIYSRGSYAVKTNSKYSKRYRYNGNLGIKYAQIKISEKEFQDYRVSNDFFVRWLHSQDPKSNPTSRFSANVNAGSSTYQTYNSNTANEYLSNTFQSNIAWNKSWQGKPFNFSMSANHSQNTINKTMDITLPEAAFSVARQYPFRKKVPIGKPKLHEKIGISGTLSAKNQVSTYDTLLFDENAMDRFRNGLKATIPISTSTNVGPVIITPSASANGYGYFQTTKKYFDYSDSTLVTDTLRSFASAYDWNAAVSASTKLYGMFLFKRGNVKAIRHVLTPSASFSYRPDFSQEKYNYYHYVQTNIAGDSALYSIFQNALYGSPASGKSGFINLGLNNNLEMKLRPSKKDTTGEDRKVVLIENLSITSAYNLAAKEFNWSNTNISGRTKLFKVVDITFNTILDPYAFDSALNKRIERFEYNVTRRPARLTSASLSVSTSLRSITDKAEGKRRQAEVKGIQQNKDELNYIMMHPDYYVDFNVPWNLALHYNVVYAKPALADTVIQSFTFSGDLSITEKWKLGFRSGYDFINKDFTFTSVDIYRDLHCWEMRFNWIPFGFRKSYMLTVAVKASVLQDLKLSRKRDWYDYN